MHYRAMVASDIDSVPTSCMGEPDEIAARIAELGSCAILGFDADTHVAQLQFRRYEANVRSPAGAWHPLYWMDFGNHAPLMPDRTICIGCYHVGQLQSGEERDRRYQGRGIGRALLETLLDWVPRNDVPALIAKATPAVRTVSSFLGGMPAHTYESVGFTTTARWTDTDLVHLDAQRTFREAGGREVATVACCVYDT
jgi:GNAT superfamily N-acetyltransferase